VASLCRTSLTPLTYLTASVSMKIPFCSLFWSWLEGLLVLGCRPLSATNGVSHSKISVCTPSYLSLMVPWMEVDGEIYDWWLWTAGNWDQRSLCLMYQKCLATVGRTSSLPAQVLLSFRLTVCLVLVCLQLLVLLSIFLHVYLLTYLLTYSMEQSSSWEANWFCS